MEMKAAEVLLMAFGGANGSARAPYTFEMSSCKKKNVI